MPALATVDDLEAVSGPVDDVDRAQRLLEMASAVVERWCSRSFARVVDDIVEIHADDGTLWLPNGPIESVTSIVDPHGLTLDATGYDEIHGHIVRTCGWWGHGTYTVTYTHGYAVIPDDVVLAVCQVAQRVMGGMGGGVTREAIGEASFSYDGLYVGPADAALLAPYRRTVSSIPMVR